MPGVSNLRSKLTLDASSFIQTISKANTQANTFSRKLAGNFQKVNKDSKKASKEMSTFADKASSGFKDVKRIIQGILVSQVFYRLAGQIQLLTREMFSLAQEVEQARVSFAGLLGDAERAGRMLDGLEDFTTRTPFTYTQVTQATRKLMAYGYEAETILPVLEGIADAVAVDGRMETWDRLALAFGQIKGKGRLMGQEMRQLHDAGIPAAQILQEELGIAREEMANIGRLNIDADVAIRALLDGIEKRFAGASIAMSRTVRGLMTTMKDNFLLLGTDLFEPAYESLRNFVYHTTQRFREMRQIAKERGIGGLIETMITPEAMQMLRMFLANLQMIRDNIRLLWHAMKPVAKDLGTVLITVFNTLTPIIQATSRVLLTFTHMLTHGTPLVRIFASALSGLLVANLVIFAFTKLKFALMNLFIVKAVAQAVIMLVQALRLVAATALLSKMHLLGVVAVIGGLVVALSLGSKRIAQAFRNLMSSIQSFFGYDPNNILQPKIKEAADTAEDFNKKIEAGESHLDDLGEAAKKAGKKAKRNLQSFDEVFTIQDPDEGAGGLDFGEFFDGLEEALPQFGEVDFPMPEFEDKVTDWVNQLTGALQERLTNALKGAGIGALIGGLIGTFLLPGVGTVLGAKIGAAAGAIAGFFWEELKENFSLRSGIGMGIGGLIGGVLGSFLMPGKGTVIGAAIGVAAGAIMEAFWDELMENAHPKTGVGLSVGAIVGAALGTFLLPGKGTIIGAAIGAIAGALVVNFWDEVKDAFKSKVPVGAGFGAIVGGLLGTFLFPGVGTVLGAKLGAAVGAIVAFFWDELKDFFKGYGPEIGLGATAGAILGSVLFPGPGTLIGMALGGAAAAIGKFFWDDIRGGIINFSKDTVPRIANWVSETGDRMDEWVHERGVEFDEWVKENGDKFTGWAKDTGTTFKNWAFDTGSDFAGWVKDRKDGFFDWRDDTNKNIKEWARDTETRFDSWIGTTKEDFIGWFGDIDTRFINWRTNTNTTINNWAAGVEEKFDNWVTNTKEDIFGWASDTKESFREWRYDVYDRFSSFWRDTDTGFIGWSKDTYDTISGWAKDAYDSVIGWWNKIMEKLEEFWDRIKFWDNETRNKEINVRINEEINQTYTGGRKNNTSSNTSQLYGRAKGGIFNKEHIAHFAEGNKMEAILPVENPAAMDKVRRAIFGGDPADFFQGIAGGGGGGTDDRPILYVGNLIADDKGLKELNRRMEVIQQQEKTRRGTR